MKYSSTSGSYYYNFFIGENLRDGKNIVISVLDL